MILLVYKALHGLAPDYIAQMLWVYEPVKAPRLLWLSFFSCSTKQNKNICWRSFQLLRSELLEQPAGGSERS